MTSAEIEAAFAAAGLQSLTPDVASRFQSYLELLQKWNARLNLTAIRRPEDIVQRHFIECILAAQKLPQGICSLLDFGSGGGFPGIPIALCRPEIHITLGESQSKKAAFLREVLRSLGIQNGDVYAGRVESLDKSFEAVALRAVDNMQEACRIAVDKLSPTGYFILFLTEETVEAVTSQFHQICWSTPLLLPNSSQRLLLIGRRESDVPRGTNGS